MAAGYRSSNALNANLALIEAAIENTLSLDGTTPNSMTAPLDMNGERIINLPAAVDANDAVRKSDFDAYEDAAADALAAAIVAQADADAAVATALAARDAALAAQTGAETAQTGAETAQTGAETAQGLSEDARDAADADAVATAADRVQTGLDVVATAADAVSTAADVVTAEAAAATYAIGICNASPVNVGFDTINANGGRNLVTVTEAGAGTNYVTFPIPNRAEASVITALYRITDKTGATPFARTLHSDLSMDSTATLVADGAWQTVPKTVGAGKIATGLRVGATGVTAFTIEIAIFDGTGLNLYSGNGSTPLAVERNLWNLAGVMGGKTASDQQLRDWTLGEAYRLASITRNSDDVVTSSTVVWPDGSGGTFTTTTVNASGFGIDAYTISHTLSGKTVTQTAVTRNTAGSVTAIPTLSVA